MTSPSSVDEFRGRWLLVALVLGGCAGLVPQLAGLVLLVALAGAAWRWPNATLNVATFVVLTVRPTLDIFSERRLGLGPLATSPAVILGLAVLWTAVILGIRRGRDRQPLWPDRHLRLAHLLLLLAYGLAIVSGYLHYGSAAFGTGLREALRMASVIAGFLIVLWWAGGAVGRYRKGWAYIAAGAVVPVSLALWQLVTVSGNLETEGINRLQGTFSHPHTLGPYVVPFILC